MTDIREIAQLGNPVLRDKAQIVEDVAAADIKTIIEAMFDTLANTQGVGLAAPQISVSKRIIIMASRPTARYPDAPTMQPTVMINPSFQPQSDMKEKDWEGCLSIPAIRALVPRFVDIKISYLNTLGKAQEQALTGFVARVFQHEYDHLEGRVYLDNVESTYDIYTENEYLKLRAV
ncbi:MAG: peptide deformylase [Methylococcaceae bacterium]|jgi:peptide deformylase